VLAALDYFKRRRRVAVSVPTTHSQRKVIMKRRYLVQALLVASLGAFASAGYAQTAGAPADKTPGSPGKTATQNNSGAMGTQMGGTPSPMTADQIAAYKQARGECAKTPAAQRNQCWTTLTTQYSGVSPKCQQLTGNALDACIHQGSTADSGGK
jgi:hypothetical protein